MHSPFNRPLLPLATLLALWRCQASRGQWPVGSQWLVLVGLKLPVTPGNHNLERGRCERQWGLKQKRYLSTCTAQSSSSDLYKVTLCSAYQCSPVSAHSPWDWSIGSAWKIGEQRVCKLQNKGVNHAAAGLPNCRCWYFKTKNLFASTFLQVSKMQQLLFWEILAFCCFPNEILNYSFS